MNESQDHLNNQLSAEQRERLTEYRKQVETDLPELRRQAREFEAARRAAAMAEPTVSGQLRRVIAEQQYDHLALAGQLGISGKMMAEFLIGKTSLDSNSIDQLAVLLKQELKPVTF